MTGWIRELDELPIEQFASAIGFRIRGRSLAPCPACHAEQRGSEDRRGPIGLTGNARGWTCYRCQATGDRVTLAAFAVLGDVPVKGDTERWRMLRVLLADRGVVAHRGDRGA